MHSDNHWSSQETIAEVIMPHAERSILLYGLRSDARRIVLLLDAWAVHKSAQFLNQ